MTATWLAGHTYVPGSLVVPSTTPPVVRTALINAGFETGSLTGWVTTKGAWTIVAGGYNSAYCAQTTTNNSDPATDGAELNNDPRVAVTPGKSITASAMAKLTNAGTDNGNAAIALMWYTGLTGSPMSASVGTHIVGAGGSWKQTTVTAVAPAGAAYVGVRLTASAPNGGNIQFDNAVWDYATQGPPPGLIYKAVQAAPGKSADTEPTWPLTNGVTVVDNTVTWEAIVMVRVVWQASPILLSGGTEPAWSTDIGGFVHDGTINWEAIDRRVSDVNCPQSKVVAIMASKVFAGDKDITRFSATANPLDWTTPQDAGYLPTGLQQANSNDIAVLAPYRSNLCPFNASTFQNWQVDPDPANMAILDQMEGIGSTYQQAASPVAQDLFYLAALGVRSVSVTASANSLVAGDIGIPIDVLVQDAMSVASANSNIPRATYYPSAGQYWLAFSHYPPDVLTITGHLPDARVGDVISFQYTVSGGVLPYGPVTITSGSLPPGLTMSTTGLVTGTLTAGGTFSWTVHVVDSVGGTASLSDTARVSVTAWWLTTGGTAYPTDAAKLWISLDPRVWLSAPVVRGPFNTVDVPGYGAKWLNGDYALIVSDLAGVERTTTLDGGAGITTAQVTIAANIETLFGNGTVSVACCTSDDNWYTSVDDGLTWQTRNDASGLHIHSVKQMTNGRWVAYQENGPTYRLVYSDQVVPTAWTAGTVISLLGADPQIAIGLNYALAVQFSGCYKTTDGANWTLVSTPLPTIGDTRGTATNGNTVIFTGQPGIARSADAGLTWATVSGIPAGTTIDRVEYSNGFWTANDESGVLYVSVNDGVTWAASATPTVTGSSWVATPVEYVP